MTLVDPRPLADTAEPAAPAADPVALPALPALRLLPAPCWEPPYDDERDPEELAAAQAAPALRLVTEAARDLVPDRPVDALPSRVLTAEQAEQDDGLDVDEREHERRRRTPADALPSAQRFSHALLQRLVEVLAGVRPLGQLERDLTLEAYEGLARRWARSPRTPGPRPTARAVRSVHVQARPEGVAEVCGTVLRGDRPVAVALRLEGRDGAWRCTDLVGV